MPPPRPKVSLSSGRVSSPRGDLRSTVSAGSGDPRRAGASARFTRTATPEEIHTTRLPNISGRAPRWDTPARDSRPDTQFVRTFYCHSQYLKTNIFQYFLKMPPVHSGFTPEIHPRPGSPKILRTEGAWQDSPGHPPGNTRPKDVFAQARVRPEVCRPAGPCGVHVFAPGELASPERRFENQNES